MELLLVLGVMAVTCFAGIQIPTRVMMGNEDVVNVMKSASTGSESEWSPEFLQRLVRPNLPPVLSNDDLSRYSESNTLAIDEATGLVTLLMLIQQNADMVELTMRSSLPHVDAWAVINTHSNPERAEEINTLLQSLADEYNTPGSILHSKFVDESQAKNQLISFAAQHHPARFFFILTATEELVDGEGLRLWCEGNRASPDARYVVRATTDVTSQVGREEWYVSSWYTTRLWKADQGLKYTGRQYATLTDPADPYRAHWGQTASGFSIIRRFESDTSLKRSYHATLGQLEQDLAENPNDCRAIYSMAVTYHNLEEHQNAIEWYERRLLCAGGLQEEIFMSELHIAKCLAQIPSTATDALVSQFNKAFKQDASRAEPGFFLAEALRKRGEYDLAYQFASSIVKMPYPRNARVWITDSVYGDQGFVMDTLAIACSYLDGHQAEGRAFAHNAAMALPHNTRIAANVQYYDSLN